MRRIWLLALLPACYFDRGGVGGDPHADGAVEGPADAEVATVDADPAAPDAAEVAIDASVLPPTCPLAYGITGDPALPHRYRFVDVSVGRGPAVADCADDSDGLTYLAIADDDDENSYLDTISDARAVWLGISDGADEGTWVTELGGVQSYFRWDSNQPDNFFNEDLAMLLDGGKWNDIGGGSARYVCECDLALLPPAR